MPPGCLKHHPGSGLTQKSKSATRTAFLRGVRPAANKSSCLLGSKSFAPRRASHQSAARRSPHWLLLSQGHQTPSPTELHTQGHQARTKPVGSQPQDCQIRGRRALLRMQAAGLPSLS